VNDWTQKRKVKHRYDLTAEMYNSRYSEEQENKYIAALTYVKPTGLVLDLGCGTGLLFSHITSTIKTIVGVDISKKLLVQAKEYARNMNNISLVQADADNLPFRNNEFDTVYVFTVLQNMPEPFKTLLEASRITKVDAMIIITGLKRVFSLKTLEQLVQSAGLYVVSINDDEKLKCFIAISQKRSQNQ
jgi:ubiquinone/menaquinone biosynthesis C-methylase UbiE